MAFSQFAEAYTGLMLQGLDPMNDVVRKFAGQQVSNADLKLDEDKLDVMERIQQLIDKAVAAGSDESVIHAYRKMLAKYTS